MWEVLTWLGKEKYWRCHLAHVDIFQDSSFEICSAGVIGEVGWGLLYLMFSRLQRCGAGFFRMAFILSTLLGRFEALQFNCPFLHSENWLLIYFNKYNVDFLCPRSQEWPLLVIFFWGGGRCFGLFWFGFQDRISLYDRQPGCPGTHFVYQAGLQLSQRSACLFLPKHPKRSIQADLELTEVPAASASWALRLSTYPPCPSIYVYVWMPACLSVYYEQSVPRAQERASDWSQARALLPPFQLLYTNRE